MGSQMSLVEALAVLEHQQFHHWIGYQVEHMHLLNWERWTHQARTPYAMLSEKEKDSDRKWARKVLEIIDKSHILISKEKLRVLMNEFPCVFEGVEEKHLSDEEFGNLLVKQNRERLGWFEKLKELIEK